MRVRFGPALILAAYCCQVGAAEIEVSILNPSNEYAVFNEVEFVVGINATEPVEKVEFRVDGKLVMDLRLPPYEVLVDVGEQNIEHAFSVTVYSRSGARTSAIVVTPPISIDLVVDLPLRQLYVSVTNSGRAILDLASQDFTVIDDGEEQELVTFEQGNVPMTIALLVDASKSMKGRRLQVALRAARGLVTRMEPLDEVLVIVFSDRIHRITASSTEIEELAVALEPLEIGGGTALNDHLYAAVRLLDQRQGRPVVILLSDGADTVSILDMQDVMWKLRRSNVTIYRIQAEDIASGPGAFATVWQDLASSRDELAALSAAITDTGGRVESLANISLLDESLDNIIQELRQQYVLGYYPSESRHDGGWRRVDVVCAEPGAVIRTRSGYIDE